MVKWYTDIRGYAGEVAGYRMRLGRIRGLLGPTSESDATSQSPSAKGIATAMLYFVWLLALPNYHRYHGLLVHPMIMFMVFGPGCIKR